MLITLQSIVDRIHQETGYSVYIAREMMPILQDITKLPTVFVGVAEELPAAPESAYGEGDPTVDLHDFAQITTEVFSLQIVTTMSDLIEVKEKVKKAVIGWNPLTIPNEYSTFRTGRGVVHALIQGRVHWYYEIKITTPTR